MDKKSLIITGFVTAFLTLLFLIGLFIIVPGLDQPSKEEIEHIESVLQRYDGIAKAFIEENPNSREAIELKATIKTYERYEKLIKEAGIPLQSLPSNSNTVSANTNKTLFDEPFIPSSSHPDYLKALSLFKEQKYAGALELFSQIMKEAPDSKEALYSEYAIAYIYFRTKDFKTAQKLFKTLAEKDPYGHVGQSSSNAVKYLANLDKHEDNLHFPIER
ncbi:MAG: tetratricopeptide repeat protein [Candidatus Riflebacteria bacterium]|nr:tetratricopeptide repeat protein [Candidatus Riflebacteria bacterium]